MALTPKVLPAAPGCTVEVAGVEDALELDELEGAVGILGIVNVGDILVGDGDSDGEEVGELSEGVGVRVGEEAEDVDLGVVELLVGVGELVEEGLGEVGVSAGGGMTLNVNIAPHSERVDPLGQQPASVQ